MLRLKLLHPELLGRLAAMGHGSQVLIADGNYPVATAAGPAAHRVYLNLAPGLVPAPPRLAAPPGRGPPAGRQEGSGVRVLRGRGPPRRHDT